MSLTKRALSEDVDVTDLRDTGFTGQPDEPSASDWAVASISNELTTLEKKGAVGYVSELKEFKVRLQRIIDKAVKPF